MRWDGGGGLATLWDGMGGGGLTTLWDGMGGSSRVME